MYRPKRHQHRSSGFGRNTPSISAAFGLSPFAEKEQFISRPGTPERLQEIASGNEGDHEQNSQYTHSNTPYNGNRSAYGYNPSGAQGSMHPDHGQLSPEMTGSPHQNGSGRVTPRTSSGSQWPTGYNTPPRSTQASNLYNIVNDVRGSVGNGHAPTDSFSSSTYATSAVNGTSMSLTILGVNDEY